jgi:hypothetical protein
MKLIHYHNTLFDTILISSVVTLANKIMQSFRYFSIGFFFYNHKINERIMTFIWIKMFSHVPVALTYIYGNEYLHIYKVLKCGQVKRRHL